MVLDVSVSPQKNAKKDTTYELFLLVKTLLWLWNAEQQ
jgi:hypothetical protein